MNFSNFPSSLLLGLLWQVLCMSVCFISTKQIRQYVGEMLRLTEQQYYRQSRHHALFVSWRLVKKKHFCNKSSKCFFRACLKPSFFFNSANNTRQTIPQRSTLVTQSAMYYSCSWSWTFSSYVTKHELKRLPVF